MENTKTRVLDAAEKLFGRRGIEGTSVREITAMARANLGAVNYYFGSKRELAAAVFLRRARPLMDEVETGLSRLAAPGPAAWPRVSEVLRAYLVPYLRLAHVHPDFVKFLGRLQVAAEGSPPRERALFHANFKKINGLFFRLLGQAAPGVPRRDLAWRRVLVTMLLSAVIANRHFLDDLAGIMGVAPDEEEMIAQLLAFAQAGIEAPVFRPRTRGKGGR
jgi:AcrR family transcriptional regulator